MKIFLSYANEQRAVAEELALALRMERHAVFFDRRSLAAGEEFNRKIHDAVGDADMAIALLSPGFVTSGRYTLTETDMMQARWPDPNGRVLPVMIETVAVGRIPAYLRAVTILEPSGNATADILAAVRKMGSRRGWRQVRRQAARSGAAVLMLLIVGYAGLLGWRWASAAPLAAGYDFLARQEVEHARWWNGVQQMDVVIGSGSRIPAQAGDVRLATSLVRMEDGSNLPNALLTHPRWASNGMMQGTYGPFRIGANLKIRGRIGFSFRHGGGGDGVQYRMTFKPVVPWGITELWAANKVNEGKLADFVINLAAHADEVGYIVLEVNAKSDAGADWANWVMLRVE